ncbi:MAG: SUMF1/EgtB/PvdO family nonheme iron enzyme [Desulfomonilaceae bacterium]
MICHLNLVSNSARTKSANWSLSLLISAFLFLACSAHLASAGQGDRSPVVGAISESSLRDPDSSENKEEISASKLYEAVSGYLEGLHRKGPSEGKSVVPIRQRREFRHSPTPDSESLRILQREENLATIREQRNEWDLAVPPLERALKVASRSGFKEDADRVEQALRTARTKASEPLTEKSLANGETINAVGMRMVLVHPGKFVMGSSSAETRRIQSEWNVEESLLQPEAPAHTVRISRPYLLGKFDVTVGQFRRFVNETGYRTIAEKQGWGWVYDDSRKHWIKKSGASWKNTGTEDVDDYPVVLVCHADAEAFCDWLEKKDGRRYYLPTEAEWEFAARGGKEGERFPWGNEYPDGKKANLADRRSPVPWADRTIEDGYARVSPVGNFEPNRFWLYDMVGNVWQLCSDYYDPKAYEEGASKETPDPAGPRTGKKKVVRGGNWAFGAGIARNAFRFGIEPDLCTDMSGFRVAAVPTPRDESPERVVGGSLLNNEQVTRVINQVKELVSSGRRLEARKQVEEFISSAAKGKGYPEESQFFVRNILEDFIDLTQDKGIQSFANSLGMSMVRIPAGSFVMGSSEADIAWAMTTLAQGQPISLENEFPFHKVRISRPFWMASTEVTVGQFKSFVNETGYITDAEDEKGGQVFNSQNNRFEKKDGTSWRNPGWKIADDQPVAMVSYNDAQAFVEWLTAKEKLPYKLPTEAQWEYAARGGLPMAQFPWGDELPDGRRANYADKNKDFPWRDRNADGGYKYVAPVGSYEPNAFGLYDMAGNVLEWVRDYYGEDYYRFTPEVDPEGPGHGENRVMKGGEWTFGPVNLRCAFRGWSRPDMATQNFGFRVIVETSTPQRIFHFANDFLTKEWVPGPDQRSVVTAIAKEKERRSGSLPGDEKVAEKPATKAAAETYVKGVMILDFSPKSDARKAGMVKGDVIIEYDGVGNLTEGKLLALAAKAKRGKIRPLVVFVRGGYEYTIRLAPGSPGISLMDTTIRGPFKRPESSPDRGPRDERDKKSKPMDWT